MSRSSPRPLEQITVIAPSKPVVEGKGERAWREKYGREGIN
ncbi:MAG: hypothetical protein ACOYEK_07060 [bacterium]